MERVERILYLILLAICIGLPFAFFGSDPLGIRLFLYIAISLPFAATAVIGILIIQGRGSSRPPGGRFSEFARHLAITAVLILLLLCGAGWIVILEST